jgi:hypothetical protein
MLTTNLLVTTSVVADQVVLTYTVPAGRTLSLGYFYVMCRSTAPPGNSNPVLFGEVSLEHPAGTKLWTTDLVGNVSPREHGLTFPVPHQVPAGDVVRVVCTPIAGTSFRWRANLGGFLT